MGEAKYRKENDPNYGKPLKNNEQRGLIISPPMKINGTTIIAGQGHIDPIELRFSLLFWDKLAWPHNNFVNMKGNGDTDHLAKCGILTRPQYDVRGDMGTAIAKGYIDTYSQLENKEPGQWAMAQSERGLLLSQNVLDPEKGAILELQRAIPIPSFDVALDDILEFKARRQDELLLFRHHLENLVLEIKNSENSAQALNKTLADLDIVCSDLLKVSKEYQLPFHISNLNTSFNINPIKLFEAGKKGWDLGAPYGLKAASAAAVAGGILSTISIKGDFGFRSVKAPKSPYRYAYSINKELLE
ncbi:hypothetical protein C4K22_1923 [Pseudomonas chlororaphis subsp. aurantiaca]|uniref:DUF6236 family protein n=1 Tax=Pseudomonas chlororaphis TaxID=587753 RepID=UPI000F575402|nr:DUF6236 family protein [Pseudomonas chlororaphis]AZD34676.1 hypothetical protein C4K22_1923 [Pseudomonas chlororaphis subsp. aurantiaca]AZD41011.1 hypothetical protein C4K21_1927 [Pseudomonas chlororaphis subsp. aurantiaca]